MPAEQATVDGDYAYDAFDVDAVDEDGYGYSAHANEETAHLYREMVEEDWVDEPLRDLLETRVSDMLDG